MRGCGGVLGTLACARVGALHETRTRAPVEGGSTSWEGLSAVSFGILFHLFSASIFSQKVFRGSKVTRVFLQPFCNLRLWQSMRAWQAGCDQRAHGEDIRLKSLASASEWHEYRGPRNPLILQDVSASFGGLGVIQRLGPTSRVCAQNGQRTK